MAFWQTTEPADTLRECLWLVFFLLKWSRTTVSYVFGTLSGFCFLFRESRQAAYGGQYKQLCKTFGV